MSSDVDICNLALSHLGDEAEVTSIAPPDGSAQAAHCAVFYPIARDAILQTPWSFNTSRAVLSKLVEAPAFGWAYAYSVPANCLAVIAVHDSGVSDDEQPREFVSETLPGGEACIFTNVNDAVCRYSRRITDSAKLPPHVVVALSWLLASYLAGPIIKGDSGRKAALDSHKQFLDWFGRAMISDAAQNRIRPEHLPPWLRDRTMTPTSESTWIR
ncbi:MAG: hypothetical protein IPM06_17810 [Rhizobiales bacterium]|nr:hypothetical protein [Hyphomicrobiales bacterium]